MRISALLCMFAFFVEPLYSQVSFKTEEIKYEEPTIIYGEALYEYRISLKNKSNRTILTWIGEENVMKQNIENVVREHFFSHHGGDFNLCNLWWDVDMFFRNNFDSRFMVKQLKPREVFCYILIGPLLNVSTLKSRIFYAFQDDVERIMFKFPDNTMFYRFPEAVLLFTN